MQLCGFEFINRLVLGPMGMNPLVYTWGGMSLILVNVLQGMLSGGPLIPAINKMRASGVIAPIQMESAPVAGLEAALQSTIT